MVKAFLRQSPLAHLHLAARPQIGDNISDFGVVISEIPHRTQITVRGQSKDPKFRRAIEKALGIALPLDPCTSSGRSDKTHVLWMGPDEWLVVAPAKAQEKLMAALSKALRGLHAALVDVSESRTVIRLGGACAGLVLAKGCRIDLHPRAFGPGQVVNSLLARSHITLHHSGLDKVTKHPIYEIFVHRSFAEYLWSWLEDASREYKLGNSSE